MGHRCKRRELSVLLTKLDEEEPIEEMEETQLEVDHLGMNVP